MCIKQFCYGKVINETEHLDIHGKGSCRQVLVIEQCEYFIVLSFQPDLTVLDTACYIL